MSDINAWTTNPGEMPPVMVGAQPPVMGAVETAPFNQAHEAHNRLVTKGRVMVAGGALAVASLLAGTGVAIAGRSGSPESVAQGPTTTTPVENNVEVCPTMFPDGPFKATQDALPGELHVRPTSTLTDRNSVMSYLFSKKGVACNSDATVSTLWTLGSDLQGAGNMGTGFGSLDTQSTMQDFLKNPAKAQQAAKILENAWKNGHVNDAPIDGPMYRVGADKTDNAELPYKPVYIPEAAVDVKKGEAFILKWNDVIGDGPIDEVDKEQLIYVDMNTGQIYVRKAIGSIETKVQDQSSTTTSTEAGSSEGTSDEGGVAPGEQPENNPNGPNQGPGKGPNGAGKTPEAKKGNDNTPNSGGGTPGGNTPGGNTPGGNTPTPTSPAPTPTSPRPPETTVPPTPPTTQRPPVTTAPPTPTTTPKGEEPAPNPSIPN